MAYPCCVLSMHKESFLILLLFINFFFALDTKDHNIDPSNLDIAEEQGNIADPYNPHAKGTISDLYYPDAHNPKGDYLSIFLYKICC